MKKIVLAGGCFWGVEAYYQRLKGVEKTRVGYANGKIPNPTYEQVKTGETNFVEAVEIYYDENIISFRTILEHLFRFIDPISLNRQGGDIGTQYRTGIYYEDEESHQEALKFIQEKQAEYDKPIVVEVKSLENFYEAEEYHQKYLDKNPYGYCHVDLSLLKPWERK
ncbi:MAG: peptide-methionine (S)-S-oxide reductase MsrA [Bacilli bacterium]|nr:peptide-methionine (S)-S-oxide reductase MsrA [Bacilli bacterium]